MSRRRDYLGWRIVWALGATEIVNYGVLTYAFAVFIVPMQQTLGVSRAAVAGAFSVQLAAAALLAPLAGAWVDRRGARSLMTACSLAAAGLVVAWSQVSSVAALYVVFAAIGAVSTGVLYEPAFTTINAWFDRDRNQALLTLTVLGGFASAVFLPTAQALTTALGWRGALVVLAGFVAATALPHAALLRRSPADLGLGRDGVPVPVAPDAPAAVHLDRVPDARAVRRTLRERRVARLTLASVLAVFATTATSVHLIAYLVEAGYAASVAATATGLLGVLSVAGRVTLSAAARRVGLARLTAVMVAGWIPAVLALRALPAPAGLVVFVILFGAGFGVMTITRASLLADFVDPLVYGQTSGVQAALLNSARVAAPVVAAWTRTSTGSYTTMLWMVCGCAAVAAAALAGCHAGRQGP